MTTIIILILLLPVFCTGQKIDVDFDALLYRHTDSCHYERVTWGTIARVSREQKKLFVIIIDYDTLELDLRLSASGRRSVHLDGYIPGTLARYFIDLKIQKQYLTVVVTDDDDRIVHRLYSRPCCRKK